MSKESSGQRAVRESGHKDASHHARTPLHHDARDTSPVSIPEVHRGEKGLDVTNTGKTGQEFAKVHAEEREWNAPAGKTERK
jgi:hypothetical protein